MSIGSCVIKALDVSSSSQRPSTGAKKKRRSREPSVWKGAKSPIESSPNNNDEIDVNLI